MVGHAQKTAPFNLSLREMAPPFGGSSFLQLVSLTPFLQSLLLYRTRDTAGFKLLVGKTNSTGLRSEFIFTFSLLFAPCW